MFRIIRFFLFSCQDSYFFPDFGWKFKMCEELSSELTCFTVSWYFCCVPSLVFELIGSCWIFIYCWLFTDGQFFLIGISSPPRPLLLCLKTKPSTQTSPSRLFWKWTCMMKPHWPLPHLCSTKSPLFHLLSGSCTNLCRRHLDEVFTRCRRCWLRVSIFCV